MSATVQRPGFYEGQIVAAADLNGVVAAARTGLAQHERYLHTWGIATGLALTGVARKTSTGIDFTEVTLGAGLAVDGKGRHLIVTDDQRLLEETFDSLNVAINDPEAWYPVFITGRDESKAPSASLTNGCGSSGASRVTERVDVVFGRVDDAADRASQPLPPVDSGPGDGTTTAPWRILVGFVKWNASIKRFSGVSDNSDGISPVHTGVRADDVITHNNRVVLRAGERGANGTPALSVEQNADGPELRFGLQNSIGDVIPVFTVNGKGDLNAVGKITGAIAGGVQVQGGIAYDGAMLPLPPGISAAQVDSGAVSIQAQVWPHYAAPALPAPPLNGVWLMHPLECRVDGRRVFCRALWRSSTAGPVDVVLPGACDYLLLAFAQL